MRAAAYNKLYFTKDVTKLNDSRAIASLVLVQAPDKVDYFIDETELDLTGGKMCVIYGDGAYEICPMSAPGISYTFDNKTEGATIVRLVYREMPLLFQVHIKEPVIKKFLVVTPPSKTEYIAGEKLDLSGLRLKAVYETDEEKEWEDVPAVDHIVESGEAVYPLKIRNLSIPIYIKVQSATLVNVSMGRLPDKIEYLERKETLDLTGATIIKEYDSGSCEEISIPPEAVRGFSNLMPGEVAVSVQIGVFTTEFNVTIKEKKAKKITIISSPSITNYIEGQEIDLTGMKLSVLYNNGENRIVEEYKYYPRIASLAEPAVKISVGTVETNIPIVVTPRQLTGISVSSLPNKMQYLEKQDRLDVTGGELRLEYNFGEPSYIPITTEMIHGFDNNAPGENVAEVQYAGFYAEIKFEIMPAQLLGLLITKNPNRVDYNAGENFESEGMVVSGFYNNGCLRPISSYDCEPSRPLTEKDVAVIVSSMDKSAVVPIKVLSVGTDKSISNTVQDIHSKEKTDTANIQQRRETFTAATKWFYPPSNTLRDMD